MHCPKCGARLKNVDSRYNTLGRRRRYLCRSCCQRWTTQELFSYELPSRLGRRPDQPAVKSYTEAVNDAVAKADAANASVAAALAEIRAVVLPTCNLQIQPKS